MPDPVSPEAAAAAAAASAANGGAGAGAGGQGAGGTAAGGANGQGGQGSGTPAPRAPEKYADFKLPDGVKLAEADLTDLQTYAKSLDLTQEQAQSLLDRTLKTRGDTEASVVAKQQAHVKELATQWGEQAKTDKEFGGDKLNENVAVAVKARDAYASPELTKMLNDSGLGNHPEVIRFFFRVGNAMSEDKFVGGGRNAGSGTKDIAQRMYPGMNP